MKNTIIKPILTEKATRDAEDNFRYAFVVDREANKIEIKKAVEDLYGVTVGTVRTMRYGGGIPKKKYTSRGVALQSKSLWKKAIVTVADGTIDLYENI